MPLRILRMLANALRMKRLHNAYTNPLPMFRCVTFTRQAILNSRFASFVMDSQEFATFCLHFVWMNANKSLQMYYDHYKCLAINKNILRLLTKMLRKQYECAFLANSRSMFLIFATPMNDRECLRTPTSVWRSLCDHCELVANCIREPIRRIFATV